MVFGILIEGSFLSCTTENLVLEIEKGARITYPSHSLDRARQRNGGYSLCASFSTIRFMMVPKPYLGNSSSLNPATIPRRSILEFEI